MDTLQRRFARGERRYISYWRFTEMRPTIRRFPNQMKIDIVTLFPEICRAPLSESIMKRAQEKGILELKIHNLRDWTTDKHHVVDDAPFGGGQGMVMKPEPIFAAVEDLRNQTSKVVLMSPAGRRLEQQHWRATLSAQESHLIVICGHYEGVDHRVIEHLVDLEISIGDYVLTNGAIAAAVLVDAVVRLLPGRLVMSNPLLMIVSVAGCWKRRSTRGLPSFTAGKSRMSCFPEITPRSRSGAKSKRLKVAHKKTARICSNESG